MPKSYAAAPTARADLVLFANDADFRIHLQKVEPMPAEHGVSEIEWEDEGDYTGVKIQDPDGYVIELAYDEA